MARFSRRRPRPSWSAPRARDRTRLTGWLATLRGGPVAMATEIATGTPFPQAAAGPARVHDRIGYRVIGDLADARR